MQSILQQPLFKKPFLPHAGKIQDLRARNHGLSHDALPQGAFCNAPLYFYQNAYGLHRILCAA